MKTRNLLLLSVAMLGLSAVSVSAQTAEFGVAGGVSKITGKDLGSGYSLDDGWNLIFRITLNGDTIFGHEFGYAYNRTNLLLAGQSTGGMAIHNGFYNFLVYGLREGKRVRPFITGGGHFSNFVPPGASATYGQGSNKFGVNYGGGVKVRIKENWLFRADVRQLLQGKPFGNDIPNHTGGTLKLNQFSVGFAFTL